MKTISVPSELKQLADQQALTQVLPFWAKKVVNPAGGLFGAVDKQGIPVPEAEQGVIMYARALWSFALAFEQTRESSYLSHAQHCYRAICDHFLDPEFGGVFFQLDAHNRVVDDTKSLIAQTYTLYALSKFYQVHEDTETLQQIDDLMTVIDTRFRRADGTYMNGLARDFSDHAPAQQQQTESCDQLHVLEALSQHYSVCPTPELQQRVSALVDMFLDRIFPASDTHLQLVFTRDWAKTGLEVSYGHNLEAPFLVHYACVLLNDDNRRLRSQQQLIRLVDLTLANCRDEFGNLLYGFDRSGRVHQTMAWWPQTEASNALLLSYELTGDERYLQELTRVWQNIQQYWVDEADGEWHTELSVTDRTPAGSCFKAGPWRCSYHTVRACFAVSRGLYSPQTNEPESSVA